MSTPHDPTPTFVERPARSHHGAVALLAFLVWLAAFALCIAAFIHGTTTESIPMVVASVVVLVVLALLLTSFTIVQPGQAKVRQFLGSYIGTIRTSGLALVPPLCSSKRVPLKIHNFETHELKVNDLDGNPINIAAIVVWRVADTAKATFAVADYRAFVETQSEAALRHVATTHPYDEGPSDSVSLRGGTEVVSAELQAEVERRVEAAGIEVVEVRISSLAYAPEIAQAMLQRQQAGAIIAAREQIVEGAVTMVESALNRLEAEDIVTLDEERKAQMVSNLLVVLCSDQRATPVVNTGSLYA